MTTKRASRIGNSETRSSVVRPRGVGRPAPPGRLGSKPVNFRARRPWGRLDKAADSVEVLYRRKPGHRLIWKPELCVQRTSTGPVARPRQPEVLASDGPLFNQCRLPPPVKLNATATATTDDDDTRCLVTAGRGVGEAATRLDYGRYLSAVF